MGLPVVSDREIGLHLFLPPGELTGALQRLGALGHAAAAAGFDLVSTGAVSSDTTGYLPTPWPFLASLLTELPTLRAGAYPVLAGLREPALLVEECEVALAALPGRLHLAVGLGYRDHDFRFCGTDPADARRRFDEVLTTLRARRLPLDAVLVAGGGPRSRAAALEHGVGLLLPPLTAPDEARTIGSYRDAGGPGRVVVQRWLAVGPADTAVYENLNAPWAPASLAPASPAELADILGRALEATGPGGVSVRIGGPLTDPDAVTAALDLCAAAISALRPSAVPT